MKSKFHNYMFWLVLSLIGYIVFLYKYALGEFSFDVFLFALANHVMYRVTRLEYRIENDIRE